MTDMGSASYWDTFYKDEGDDDEWLMSFQPLQVNLIQLMADDCRVLHIGCGNSRMAECIYDMGTLDIVNIDHSKVVIDQMAARAQEEGRNTSRFKHEHMCVTKMTFDPGVFDLCLDKATLDTVMCSRVKSAEVVPRALQQIHRALAPGGVYLFVSHAAPTARISVFRAVDLAWRVSCLRLAEGATPKYVYICRKEGSGARVNPMDLTHRGLEFDVTFYEGGFHELHYGDYTLMSETARYAFAPCSFDRRLKPKGELAKLAGPPPLAAAKAAKAAKDAAFEEEVAALEATKAAEAAAAKVAKAAAKAAAREAGEDVSSSEEGESGEEGSQQVLEEKNG